MRERPTYTLVYGWLLQNYHYISAIAQHVCGAIAACPDPVIRGELVHHLEEELGHGELLSLEQGL
jgi:pyrroloquinoline quinone (PQQ) biosynthesis protein C